MPVGTAGTMKGMHWRKSAIPAPRWCSGIPIISSCGQARNGRGARRTADLYRLVRADADGQRRLPGDSLSDLIKVSENAVTFRSHIDGAKVELTPERSIAVQRRLGADLTMEIDTSCGCPTGGRRRACDAAVAALGGALQAGVRDRA